MISIITTVCIVTYLAVLFSLFLKKDPNSEEKEKELVIIKAPTKKEIEIEKAEQINNSVIFPDKEFEKIVEYILKHDPNPRKVVKLMQNSFSENDKNILLKCLSINNPILYNEVMSLQYCDSSDFEEFEGVELDVELDNIPESLPETREMQTGIPAEFFLSALEYDTDRENVLNNIVFAYDNLNQEEQNIVLAQCIQIQKKKNRKKDTPEESFTSIMQEADKNADLFMQLYKEALANQAI